jgi:hypothetical protein
MVRTDRMDALEHVVSLATSLGIHMEVPKDRDEIDYYPRENATDELLGAMKKHKPLLMRHLLMDQALDYVGRHWDEDNDWEVLVEPSERMEKFWPPNTSFAQFRQAIRDYVTAGLQESKRVRAAKKKKRVAA